MIDCVKGTESFENVCLFFDTPTWRANTDWLLKMGYKQSDLVEIAENSMKVLKRVKESTSTPMIIGGRVGPRGDGYIPSELMTPKESEIYHLPNIYTLKNAGVDVISILTMTNPEEPCGMASICSKLGIPYIVSFTLETNGALPNG